MFMGSIDYAAGFADGQALEKIKQNLAVTEYYKRNARSTVGLALGEQASQQRDLKRQIQDRANIRMAPEEFGEHGEGI